MRSSFFLSSLMGSVLSLKLDGLSPLKLDRIADDSDLLSSRQAEVD
jgi:hypothetical protein